MRIIIIVWCNATWPIFSNQECEFGQIKNYLFQFCPSWESWTVNGYKIIHKWNRSVVFLLCRAEKERMAETWCYRIGKRFKCRASSSMAINEHKLHRHRTSWQNGINKQAQSYSSKSKFRIQNYNTFQKQFEIVMLKNLVAFLLIWSVFF